MAARVCCTLFKEGCNIPDGVLAGRRGAGADDAAFGDCAEQATTIKQKAAPMGTALQKRIDAVFLLFQIEQPLA
jgi:hypothetical protein